MDPFEPVERDGKLFGLGSNDAGGCLVSMMAAFAYFYHADNLSSRPQPGGIRQGQRYVAYLQKHLLW